jgi:signal transduction histidine kinase
MGLLMVKRFLSAVRTAEDLNASLETRVAAAQQALATSYHELRLLETRRAAQDERERIYRDLHDDVGAKLLGLAISAERASLPREADLARSALQDLRDVVSRSSQATMQLTDLLADLRAETEQRVKAAGLELDWQLPHDDADLTIGAETTLHLSRILREAITNVLRHAQATRISVVTSLQADAFSLEVEDDGKGCDIAHVKAHRGMTGMRSRATVLGGTLEWSPVTPHGCRIALRIPMPPERGGEIERA